MLKSDLNFYKDSRFATGVRLGSIFMSNTGTRAYLLFIPVKGYEAIKLDVQDPVLTNILNDMGHFLARIGSPYAAESEDAVANGIAARLPHNLRMSQPSEWPPDRVGEAHLVALDEAEKVEIVALA